MHDLRWTRAEELLEILEAMTGEGQFPSSGESQSPVFGVCIVGSYWLAICLVFRPIYMLEISKMKLPDTQQFNDHLDPSTLWQKCENGENAAPYGCK